MYMERCINIGCTNPGTKANVLTMIPFIKCPKYLPLVFNKPIIFVNLVGYISRCRDSNTTIP